MSCGQEQECIVMQCDQASVTTFWTVERGRRGVVVKVAQRKTRFIPLSKKDMACI